MTRENVLFVVTVLIGMVAWTVTYRRIGGKFPPNWTATPSPWRPRWVLRWRSVAAALVGGAIGTLFYWAVNSLWP
jgi:hypothetical protein